MRGTIGVNLFVTKEYSEELVWQQGKYRKGWNRGKGVDQRQTLGKGRKIKDNTIPLREIQKGVEQRERGGSEADFRKGRKNKDNTQFSECSVAKTQHEFFRLYPH